jgi:acyl-CoA synthetase (AMP-forming)/AMP-acid ligase II
VSLPEQALASAETPRDLLRHLRSAQPGSRATADHEVMSLVQAGAASMPTQAKTLTEAFLWHVERQPQRLTVFLYDEGREHQLSYAALYEASLGYAARFAAAGLQPGQTVAIMLPTRPEYLYCFYGVLLAGGVPVPLYPPARLSTIEDHLTRHIGILTSARATLLVTIAEAKALAYLLQAQVESLRGVMTPADFEAPPSGFSPLAAKPGDVAFLQYTSGSTGQPKGVVLTHENLMANVRAMGKAVHATSDDVFVSWLPLYHDMGLIGGCFATLYHGFPVVLMSPLAFLGRPAQWLWAIHRHRGTMSGGPNFAYELCLRRTQDAELEGLDLSSWRFAFNGAEPVSPETIRAFEARFAQYGLRKNVVSPVYGLAECSVGVAFTTPGEPWIADRIERDHFARTGEARPAAADPAPTVIVGCGRAIPDHDMRVVDSAGIELPERCEGHLEFRGPSATSGYLRNPEATKALFDGDWLRTGDRAYFADGMLYLTGREKDIIIRGGRNISPYELEEAIGDLEGVRRGCVAVFGSLDRASGTEKVVVLAEERRPARRTAHADQRPRTRPHRHAGRRHRARATAIGAEDLERQDPARREPRVLRAWRRRGQTAAGVVAVRAPGLGRVRSATAPRPARAGRHRLRCARVGRVRPGVSDRVRLGAACTRALHLAPRSSPGTPVLPALRATPQRARARESAAGRRRHFGRQPYELSRPDRAARAARLARLRLRRQARIPR